MSKKLTLSQLSKEAKKYDSKKKIPLTDEFHTYISPYFNPKKLKEMVIETLSDFQKNELEDINMMEWLHFNVIRHFSDLEIPEEIESKLKIYNELQHTGLFETIVLSFPKESMERLKETLDTINNNITNYNSLNKEDKEIFADIANMKPKNILNTENKVIQ